METERSEFNVAVSYLNTVNELQAFAADAAINLDITKWRHILAAMFRRISPYILPNERDELKLKLMIITDKINKVNSIRWGVPKIDAEIYESLSDFEMIILSIAKEKGLTSKMEDDDDD